MPHVLSHLMQHRQHGYVGLASAGGGTHQQVLVAVQCCGVDAALDAVQGPATCKKKVLRSWPLVNRCVIRAVRRGIYWGKGGGGLGGDSRAVGHSS